MAKNLSVHIVDDDPMQLEMLKDHFAAKPGVSIKTFTTGEAFLENYKTDIPNVLILDYNLNSTAKGAIDGVSVLVHTKQRQEEDKVDVIMFSGQDNIDVAVSSLTNGAFDYVVKGETAFARLDSAFAKLNRFKAVSYTHLDVYKRQV